MLLNVTRVAGRTIARRAHTRTALPRKEQSVNVFAAMSVVLTLAATLFVVLPVIEQRIDREHSTATRNFRRS